MRRVLGRCCWLAILLCAWLGMRPEQVHADGGAPNLAYVSGTSKSISIIHVLQGRVVGEIALAGDPHTILLSLDGSALYVTQPKLDQLSIVATRTRQVVCTAHIPGKPTLLALDTSTNLLYTGGNGSSRVSVVDAKTCALRHTYEMGSPVYGLAIASAGSGLPSGNSTQLWVSGTDALSILDIRTGTVLAHITIPGGPRYLTAPPGSVMYVTTRQGSVFSIDYKTQTIHELLNGGSFGPMDYDALTGEVYVPDQRSSSLAVLTPVDPALAQPPKEPGRIIRTSAPPTTVAITSDGLLGFVALRNGQVALLDVLARQFVDTIQVGGAPHFIITGLFPPVPAVPATPVPKEPAEQRTFWNILPGSALLPLLIVYGVTVLSLLLIFGWLLRRVLRERRQKHT
jgi:DNA-binding beta-propeller fold protein YncE